MVQMKKLQLSKMHKMGDMNRLFSSLVISPAGRTIKEFGSVKEVLTALCDAIKAHRSLLTKAKLLHRDISENNIIITDPKTADDFTGILINLDLAIIGGERTPLPRRMCRLSRLNLRLPRVLDTERHSASCEM
jgi:hypothetical protein